MPEFAPGESKIAVATFPVKPAGLPCTAKLWLGSDSAKVATSGEVPFVSTGAEQAISLPITMPDIEGTHPVYLDVFSNGQLIGAYQALEGVVISAPLPSIDITGFHYVYRGAYTWSLTGLMIHGGDISHIGFFFRNNEAVNVPGVSVKFRLVNTITAQGPSVDRELTIPYDQYLHVIPQPFTIASGSSTGIWYSWSPVTHYTLRHATAIAEVWINGQLAASAIMEFDVQYG